MRTIQSGFIVSGRFCTTSVVIFFLVTKRFQVSVIHHFAIGTHIKPIRNSELECLRYCPSNVHFDRFIFDRFLAKKADLIFCHRTYLLLVVWLWFVLDGDDVLKVRSLLTWSSVIQSCFPQLQIQSVHVCFRDVKTIFILSLSPSILSFRAHKTTHYIFTFWQTTR